ncbi:MAG: AmmeMemoRadiSam system protein A [Planctomycetes bacterium]|nr:AmmeMemoRadiSam system protein A [Planctomycetota bacterium]
MRHDERATLLEIARAAVTACVCGQPPPPVDGLPLGLLNKGAAFVTLRCDGELRGCVGHIEARQPLWRSVQEMAMAAAERDTRFTPVGAEELPRLSIDISVLSPMRRAQPDEVQIGTHGLYLRLRGASGLLLPQVAVEWGWDRSEFLHQVCRKAGLAGDAYLDPAAELYTFTAELVHTSP